LVDGLSPSELSAMPGAQIGPPERGPMGSFHEFSRKSPNGKLPEILAPEATTTKYTAPVNIT
jgi:hypothetical protein